MTDPIKQGRSHFILQTQNLGREPEDVVNPEANKIKGKRSLYSAA